MTKVTGQPLVGAPKGRAGTRPVHYDIPSGMHTTNGGFCAWLGSKRNVPRMLAANAVSPVSSRIAEAGSTDHTQAPKA